MCLTDRLSRGVCTGLRLKYSVYAKYWLNIQMLRRKFKIALKTKSGFLRERRKKHELSGKRGTRTLSVLAIQRFRVSVRMHMCFTRCTIEMYGKR